MILIVLVLLAIAALVILGLAAAKPDEFRLSRSTTIRAPREKIFPLINDFHHWASWSPFEKLDPAMKKTFSGAARGRGAVYEWSGNQKAGAGRMEILEAPIPDKVVIKLDFLKPFEGHNVSEFTLDPGGDSTGVTWAMRGPSPFMMKVMRVFINMDRMIGKDFEEGLANLKTVAEKKST